MNLILGVSGSVAAYRAADLARELMRAGFAVRVLLTEAAARFVSPALFEALTGEPCLVGAFEEPVPGRMAHIDWARWADVLVVAPATANTVARLAGGIGGDMLTTVALATAVPLLVAPAMNPQMYASEAFAKNLRTLRERGIEIVEPVEGDVACGEHGQGKLASVAEIVRAVRAVAEIRGLLMGKRVLITSGPTVERLDDVRFLSNRSSGKMGAALARAALNMGARVHVIAGPQSAILPLQCEISRVESAEEMLAAGLGLDPEDSPQLIIGAAAVADYRPKGVFHGKLRRSGESVSLDLVPNPDVIASLAQAHPKAVAIGFAAEPSSDLTAAREKLARKGLWGIAANDVRAHPFGGDLNALTLITAEEEEASGERTKLECANWLLQRAASELSHREKAS